MEKTGDGSNRRRKKGCIFLPVRASLTPCLADMPTGWMRTMGTILLTAHEYESRKAPAGNSITHTRAT